MYGKYYPRQAHLRLHPNFAIPPCGPSTRRRHYQPTEPAMKKQRRECRQKQFGLKILIFCISTSCYTQENLLTSKTVKVII